MDLLRASLGQCSHSCAGTDGSASPTALGRGWQEGKSSSLLSGLRVRAPHHVPAPSQALGVWVRSRNSNGNRNGNGNDNDNAMAMGMAMTMQWEWEWQLWELQVLLLARKPAQSCSTLGRECSPFLPQPLCLCSPCGSGCICICQPMAIPCIWNTFALGVCH